MRYNNNDIKTNKDGIKYYKNKIYPVIPYSETDVYIITTVGDRLDLLANSYYKDVDDWWIIYMANNNVTKGSMFPIPGTQLRIPINVTKIKQEYQRINSIK